MAQLVIRAFVAAVVAAVVALPAFGQTEVAAPAPAAAKLLAEGDSAPSLEGLTWLKGDAVTKFESGHIYIVEMWATWCGPCKRGIPHLTQLQAKHKDKLTVVGISLWERADTASARVATARSFVESQGAAMVYTVAADGDGVIVREWMQAAGRRSIPTAFIIDGFGNIAWIGNPLSGMDGVLEKVLAGGFDARAEAAKAKIAAAAKRIKDEKFARANLLAQQEKFDEALAMIDELLAMESEPGARVPVNRQKLRMLLRADEARAYAFARSMLEGEMRDSDYGLFTLADSIMRGQGLKSFDHALVVELLTRSAALAAPGNAAVHETLAAARFRAGDAAGAIAAAEQALEVMKQPGSMGSAAAVARVQKALVEYRAGAEGTEPDAK